MGIWMCAPALNISGDPTAPLRHRTFKTRMCAPALNISGAPTAPLRHRTFKTRMCAPALKQLDNFQETDTVTSLYSHLNHTRTRLNSHWTASFRYQLLY